jgi:hypothetical protein
MNLNIKTGKASVPERGVIYGPQGWGKSSIACAFPEPLALDGEQGLNEIGPSRVDLPATWPKLLDTLRAMCSGAGDWRTVVIDTADKLEDMAKADILSKPYKGKACQSLIEMGWDGWTLLTERWTQIMDVLDTARTHGRAVILVAHTTLKTQEDPGVGEYQKAVPMLSRSNWGLTHRWADMTLFGEFERARLEKEKRVILTGVRHLRTRSGSGYDAKNRWNLPDPMVSYAPSQGGAARTVQELLAAKALGMRESLSIEASIRAMARGTEFEAKAEAYILEAAGSAAVLADTERQLREKLAAASAIPTP